LHSFLLHGSLAFPTLHSFPTRRSSDLLQIAKLSFQAVSISRRLSLRVGEALGRPLGITECLVILLFVEFEPSIKLAHLQSQATHPAFFVASPRRYIVASCGSVIVRVSPPPLLFLCRRYAIALA